ncbi:MAG: sulfotransferase [Bacteroidetes bacterium]|jgi:hypothetical protein|nr:sulfotransferase [Bacteroidota bacterium]
MRTSNKTRSLPDFIGIGAQRSGSQWLYKHLNLHPEIWMPPIKEIHFFDRFDTTVKLNRSIKLMHDLRRRANAYIFRRKWNKQRNLHWDLTYFLKVRDSDWYTSLFLPGADKITGEISPSYMILDQKTVENIYSHNPKLKIIFIMRDPIDRVWSAAIRDLAKNKQRDARTISIEEFQIFIQDIGASLRSNYVRTLSIWESVFPPEQFYINFYDNVQNNPQEFLTRIFEFLGVPENSKHVPKKLRKKVNSSERYKIDIPIEIEHEIVRMNLAQLEELHLRFGGVTTKWWERSKKVLG